MIVRTLAALVAAVALLGAAPAARVNLGPVPNNAQTGVVKRYLDALKAARYADAFALLNPAAKAYFRSAENYASVFIVDDFSLTSYALSGSRGNASARVYVARESVRFREPDRDDVLATTIDVPYGVIGDGANARIKDPGKPWRAYGANASQTVGQVRLTVRKVAFYARYIAIVVTYANLGDSYVTLLPYGRSVLRDDRGTAYPLIAEKKFTVTDRKLFLGVRLAPNEQYTGSLAFAATGSSDGSHPFTLTVAPNLRDGGDEPFSIEVTGIGPERLRSK